MLNSSSSADRTMVCARLHMRHATFAAVFVGLLVSAGCSSERRALAPVAPSDARPSEPSVASQRLAALALFQSASLHAEVMTSALIFAIADGKVWTNSSCGSGSLQGSVDGVPPAPGTLLPTGSHTYAVSFTNCELGLTWWGVRLNGVASGAYNAAEFRNITATVSADSLRGTGLEGDGLLSERPYDVTADGSAVWTFAGSSVTSATYTPATGSRLTYNSTDIVGIFGGGSYSRTNHPSGRAEQRFHNLTIAVNGTVYTLSGTLDTTVGNSLIHSGEVQIISNGTLAARLYGNAGNALTIEVLVPLVPIS